MRCLLLHCNTFAYRTVVAKDDVDSAVRPQLTQEHDVLLVFVAVEPADADVVSRVAKDVRRQARRAEACAIVVNPFVHLTDNPAQAAEAQEIARALCDRLSHTAEVEVRWTSFGLWKEFALDVYGHRYSQSFISMTAADADGRLVGTE